MQPVKRKGGRQWRKLRAALLDQEPLCRSCMATGRVTAATEVDHITPLHKGGQEYQASNLQPMCKPCHDEKTLDEQGVKGKVAIGLDGWPVEKQRADTVLATPRRP